MLGGRHPTGLTAQLHRVGDEVLRGVEHPAHTVALAVALRRRGSEPVVRAVARARSAGILRGEAEGSNQVLGSSLSATCWSSA